MQLWGDIDDYDLIKIHIISGKLSLMKYDDFENVGLPKLRERVKINMIALRVDIFEYGEEFPQQYLFSKSKFINEDFKYYEKQTNFESHLKPFLRVLINLINLVLLILIRTKIFKML